MQFESHLSDEDFTRAAAEPMTPPVLTGATLSQLNAIEAFWIRTKYDIFRNWPR